MTGFQTKNTAGAIVVDADFTPIYYSSMSNIVGQRGFEAPSQNTLFGNTGTMQSFITWNGYGDGQFWLQLGEGKRAYPSPGYFDPTGSRYVKTSTTATVESGYLDVFNAQGKLTWSAKQSTKVPRITGIFTIPANFDLDNAIYQEYIGYSPFILCNGIPGNASIDGEGVGGRSGILLRYQNGYLQCCYISYNQRSWAGTYKPYGMNIPYGLFPNLN